MPSVIALRRHFLCRYQKPSPSAGNAFMKIVSENYLKQKQKNRNSENDCYFKYFTCFPFSPGKKIENTIQKNDCKFYAKKMYYFSL